MRRRHLALALLPLMAGCAMFEGPLSEQPPRIVFFTEDSAALDEPAVGVVANAARLANRYPSASVEVLGYAGPVGGQQYNVALSQARAKTVEDALLARGVAASRITVRGRGPVAYELAPIESRRVEIRVIPAAPAR
jgi:outer membrane protein OmpA-like peptidoglycan-associated protein